MEGSKRSLFGQVSPHIQLQVDAAVLSGGEQVHYLTGTIPLNEPSIIAIGAATDTLCTLQTMLLESQSLASSLVADYEVSTPDKFINPLEFVLPAAANGIWDEASGVWQHGAIGWRMPLPGWRAAYVGDVMGWPERQHRHFAGYAASQVIGVDVDKTIPVLDPSKNLARATEKLGNPMFTTGYIGRFPNNPNKVNHYDMNLVFIDELLWHLNWTGDLEEAREFWPTIVRHLAWEKRVFDPDDDGLYDAYCCIWASDGLYYDGGAVTHSSAYNLRANREAAKIARLLGETRQAEAYEKEAEKIQHAIDEELWLEEEGVWAECKDAFGLKRQHKHPGLCTVYHAIDSEVGTPLQRYRATQYVDKKIPQDGNDMPSSPVPGNNPPPATAPTAVYKSPFPNSISALFGLARGIARAAAVAHNDTPSDPPEFPDKGNISLRHPCKVCLCIDRAYSQINPTIHFFSRPSNGRSLPHQNKEYLPESAFRPIPRRLWHIGYQTTPQNSTDAFVAPWPLFRYTLRG